MRNRTSPYPHPSAGLPVPLPPLPPLGRDARDPSSDQDDILLALRAREGDDEAFAVLVRRHSSHLLLLAQRLLGDSADAEDAVQEAFFSAWRQLPHFRHSASFGTWMYRIVTNRCLNVLRCRPHPMPLESVAEPAAPDPGSSPPRAAEIDAATAALVRALMELRPELRACWVLRELHGLHYGEIAHILGASEQTVRGRLSRARRALMEAMRPWR